MGVIETRLSGIFDHRRFVTKTFTFTGAAGNGAAGLINIFTVTGAVLILEWSQYCSADLTRGGTTGTNTLSFGTTNNVASYINVTDITTIVAPKCWADTNPSVIENLTAGVRNMQISENLVYNFVTSGDRTLNGGTLVCSAWWTPISLNGNLV